MFRFPLCAHKQSTAAKRFFKIDYWIWGCVIIWPSFYHSTLRHLTQPQGLSRGGQAFDDLPTVSWKNISHNQRNQLDPTLIITWPTFQDIFVSVNTCVHWTFFAPYVAKRANQRCGERKTTLNTKSGSKEISSQFRM